MDDDRVYSELKSIGKDISVIKMTQGIHTSQLTEHMRRTALLEEAQELHEKADLDALDAIDKKLEPMDEFLKGIKGIKYLIWALGAVLGIAIAVSKLL